MKKLPLDVARCATGKNCWKREQCARWAYRKIELDEFAVWFIPTPPEQGQECEYIIPTEITND
jgi:hypothetical protein